MKSSPEFLHPRIIVRSIYGTALVQRHKYARATHVVVACGPRVYSRDT